MNRIILVVFLVLSYCVGTSQSISQRSQPVITVQDGRLFAQYNFRPPVFADTVEANLQIGLDSCGALIFSRSINSYYLRACSPKRWVKVSGAGSDGTVTSVAVTNGTGISASIPSGTETTTPNITITNTAPDQTVVLNNGAGINVTGTYPEFTIAATGTSGVTSVGATPPLSSTGGATPSISITQANASQNGYLSFGDWNTFNNKGNGTVLGNGSQYYIPKWSNTTTLQNSQIFDDGTFVGINTNSPAYKLDVSGTTRIKGSKLNDVILKVDDSLNNELIKVKFDGTTIRGGTIPLTIIGSGGVQSTIGNDYFASPPNIAKYNTGVLTFYGRNNDENGFNFDFANSQQSISTVSSMINLGGIYNNQQAFQFSNLLISPTYNFDSTNVTSSAIARGIYYNPTIPLNGLRSAKHIAFENKSGDIIHRNLGGVGNKMVVVDNDGKLGTQTIPEGGGGTVTSIATSGLISGGNPTAITTIGTISTSMNSGKLVGRNTTGVGIMEEITVGDGLTLTGAGVLNNTATPTPLGYYGSFYDTTTQVATDPNTAYAVKLGKTTLTNGVSILNNASSEPTRIDIKNAGVYNLQFSLQLEKTSGSGNMTVDIWLRKNGVDIPNTTGKIVLTGSVNASPTVSSWNYVLETSDGQYYELMWATTNVGVKIIADVASSPHPAIPSAIFTVTQQSGIMAGTGITGMGTLGNIQLGPTQRLATGTAGTDFTITSASNIHTFDIPNASTSSVTRGLISNAQYNTFNGKQDAITGGASTITSTDLTVSRALISNASGKVAISGTTSTELGYVSGVTSAIQTQLNSKGYTLALTSVAGNIATTTPYYFGNQARAITTTADVSKVYIPKSGTIKKAYITLTSGTTGTITSITVNVRVNNTTDYLVATSTANTVFRTFNNNSLAINVSEGDYIEMKVTSVLTVAPITNIFSGTLYIE
jgi:hypothetical protein